MNIYINDREIKRTNLEDKAASVICKLISLITNKFFVSAVKIAVIFAAAFGFVATVGSVSNGNMSFGVGILICALLSFVEILAVGSLSQGK